MINLMLKYPDTFSILQRSSGVESILGKRYAPMNIGSWGDVFLAEVGEK